MSSPKTAAIGVGASLASLAICAGIAYAAGYPPTGNQLANDATLGPVIAYAAAVSMGIQWIAFVPAFVWQTERYYDLVGSITYTSVTLATLIYRLAYSNTDDLVSNVRPIVCSLLVVVWAVRLGSFLVKRVFRAGKDGRFDDVKPYFAAYLAAWTIQGLWVFLTLLPVLVVNTTSRNKAPFVADYVGWAVWLLGFSIEVVSDNQKSAFTALKTGKWIDTGLWSYSRHPNYFGEITLWVGQFIVGISVYQGGQWIAVLGPVWVFILLNYITGIPLLEKRADEKWGGNPEYEQYKKEVSILAIVPRKQARQISPTSHEAGTVVSLTPQDLEAGPSVEADYVIAAPAQTVKDLSSGTTRGAAQPPASAADVDADSQLTVASHAPGAQY